MDEYWRIKLAILFSGRINKIYRKKFIAGLTKDAITHKFPDGEHSSDVRFLFYMGMYYRLYDLYTTSIYALTLCNEVSLILLVRAQLENYALTEHVLKHPADLEKIFIDKIDYSTTLKSLEQSHSKLWGIFSQYGHSLPEGLKTPFWNVKILNPKDMQWMPMQGFTSHHYTMSDEDKEELIKMTLFYYTKSITNLEKVLKLDVHYNITDVSILNRKDFWEKKRNK